MKVSYKSLTGVAICLALAGCVSTDTKTNTRVQEHGVQSSQVNKNGETEKVVKTIHCPSPVAKISVLEMKCKAAKCASSLKPTGNLGVLLALSNKNVKDFSTLGGSMTTMLASSIASTNCFTLLDRESMEEVKKEMELSGLKFTPETSDFVITGAITSFEYEENETGLGSFLGSAGGLLSNKETTAKMGLDMRLIDVESSRVAYTKTYKSDASNDNYSVGFLGFGSGGGAAGGAKFGGDIEVEEAVRTVINQSVFDLVRHAAKGKYEIVTSKVN